MTTTAPHLREDLLTPLFDTTEIEKAARTDLDAQRGVFEAMLSEMETDSNRDHLLGPDPHDFDAQVMHQMNRTARRAFPWLFDLAHSHFLELRDRLVADFQEMQAARQQGANPLRQLGLTMRFGALLVRQFCQPMLRVEGT